jgi:shikimate dehydrogenase
MHNAAYAALGIDAAYVAFDVVPEKLGEAFTGIRALGLRQVSVSIPHKTAVLELVDAVDDTAARIGAANTIVRDGDRLVASNTDWIGAVRSLEAECSLAGARAVVLGAGGTARAVVWGLVARGRRRARAQSQRRARRSARARARRRGRGSARIARRATPRRPRQHHVRWPG